MVELEPLEVVERVSEDVFDDATAPFSKSTVSRSVEKSGIEGFRNSPLIEPRVFNGLDAKVLLPGLTEDAFALGVFDGCCGGESPKLADGTFLIAAETGGLILRLLEGVFGSLAVFGRFTGVPDCIVA